MKFFVVHQTFLPTGEAVAKWFPSSDYKAMAAHLIERMTEAPEYVDWLAVPFVLTLAASLEANLNDWLTLDALHRHGREHYRPILDAHLRCPFGRKLRLAVAVLTDNRFHLRENVATTTRLDELISVRNQLTHPNADYHVVEKGATLALPPKMRRHPVHELNLETCRRLHSAVTDLDENFFSRYDKNTIGQSHLIIKNPVYVG